MQTVPRHLLCDMDGTIIDTEGLKCVAWRMAVADAAGSEPDPEEHEAFYSTLAGMPGPRMAEDIITHYGLSATPAELHALREKHREALYGAPGELASRAISDTLGFVRLVAEGLRMTGKGKAILVTTAGRDQVDRVMAALPLASLFDAVVCGEEKSVENPACYRSALRLVDAPPVECLALEDTFVGYRAARSLGIPCLLLPNRFTRAQAEAGR